MLNNNIDINDARQNTVAPFICNGGSSIAGVPVTYDMFLSIRIKCTADSLPPVYMERLELDNSVLSARFSDSTGSLAGFCQFLLDVTEAPEYRTCFIFEDTSMQWPVGHVVYRSDVPGFIKDALEQNELSYVSLGNSFELMPECVGIRYPRSSLKVSVNGTERHRVGLICTDGTTIGLKEGNVQLSAFRENSIQIPVVLKGIQRVCIQNLYEDGRPYNELEIVREGADLYRHYWVPPCRTYDNVRNILIEPCMDSDIRVNTDASIRITGAIDAK